MGRIDKKKIVQGLDNSEFNSVYLLADKQELIKKNKISNSKISKNSINKYPQNHRVHKILKITKFL